MKRRKPDKAMIYVLPGMGADNRMYAGPWRSLPGCVFLDWPANAQEESIAGIADRVLATAGIPDGATLVGSSLGGIVACEIAKLRRIEKLFLVGSARNNEEISSILRILHPLIDLAPLTFIQRASGKIPGELLEMFSASDARFIWNMCWAIFVWDGLLENTVLVCRIHGRFDLVIPPPPDVDILIEGGHLIAMTHAAECVRFIESKDCSHQRA
jgi:pimeloyl-ACP methyl ester carboxylesterase